jgi:hypothetical protein
MAPFDFFLWDCLKSLIFESPMEMEEDLAATILTGRETMHNILAIFEMVRQSVVCHYSVCIEVIVSDFEQLL